MGGKEGASGCESKAWRARTARSARPRASFDLPGAGAHWPEIERTCDLDCRQLRLDGRVAYAELNAADEKNREGNSVAIRDDLAADLRDWLADKLAVLQAEARKLGEPIPSRLSADARLFTVPKELVKILNRDLTLAGISKTDDRGRTFDVHALRTTFGTLLSKGALPRAPLKPRCVIATSISP